MLGWMFIVHTLYNVATKNDIQKLEVSQQYELGRWQTSMHGTDWVYQLVKEKKAEFFAHGGYPAACLLRADSFLVMFNNGIPKHSGFPVIGDDYVMSGSHVSNAKLYEDRIVALDDSDLLIVYMWDLS